MKLSQLHDGARVMEIAKSLNKKWFKENDPSYDD